ncbi:MAG: hypothetical protein M1816_001604 [Peltula sp. TS41687]|nr:MAG: hypothetical protein M1816_001604 [Peltula sp. TS41687]
MSHKGPEPRRTIFVGTFISCRTLQQLDICVNGAVGVDLGNIAFFEKDVADIDALARNHGWEHYDIVTATDTQFFFPGFIDTHIHAPQYPNSGIFGKSTLMDWLRRYTFPMESSLGDLKKAKTVYSRCVARTLSHGTTTAAYYATVHVESTNLLADICLSAGQRAFIGRVCMDRMSPPDYRDSSADSAIEDTKATISHMRIIDSKLEMLCPVLTPRFAPSCTPAALEKLGELHKETQLPIQTHISENISECDLVRELFPDSPSYAAVYDRYGLLTSKTILAHGIYLSNEERELIKQREAKISHCPVSNSALSSGAARVRWLLDGGITVGLGTDVSGGYSPSVLEAMRHAALVSRHVSLVEGDAAKLSMEEVLYLATRGGAKVLGIDHKVGGFEVGMEWDAQLIGLDLVPEGGGDGGTNQAQGPVDIFGWENTEERLAKWIFVGDDRNTLAVWVKGRLVHHNLR